MCALVQIIFQRYGVTQFYSGMVVEVMAMTVGSGALTLPLLRRLRNLPHEAGCAGDRKRGGRGGRVVLEWVGGPRWLFRTEDGVLRGFFCLQHTSLAW